MTNVWTPRNYRGSWNYDPKDELQARIEAFREFDSEANYITIPLMLARALVKFQECGDRTTLHSDEDGPLPKPVKVQCRLEADHKWDHYNGYVTWKRDA